MSDIVDHLNSTATDLPLSANQGRVLDEYINSLSLEEVVIFSGQYGKTAGTDITLSEPINSYEYLYFYESGITGNSTSVGGNVYVPGRELKNDNFYNPHSSHFGTVYLASAKGTNVATLLLYKPDLLKLRLSSTEDNYSEYTLLGYKKK